MVTEAYYARARAYASSDGSSALQEGEVVVVHERNASELCRCQKITGDFVNVPCSVLNRISVPENSVLKVSFVAYESLASGDISFDKFAIIALDDNVDGSWARGAIVLDNGKRVGQSGLFPLCYVLDLPPLPTQSNGSGTREVFRTATVVADMSKKLNNEVDLRKGEQVRVLKLESDWCEVETEDGRTGTCPRPFLKMIEPATSQSLSVHLPTELEKTFSVPSPRGEQAAETRPYCRALFQFRGEYNGELNFDAGELIYLRRRVDDEWLEGESQKSGSVGMLPTSFVEIVVDLLPEGASATPSENANKRTSQNEPETIGLASVLYDFQARYPDELSVKAGYSVKVLEVTNDEWARCWNPVTDEEGIIPQGFLQIFLDDDADDAEQGVHCRPPYYEPPPVEDDGPGIMSVHQQQVVQETSRNSWYVPEPLQEPCVPEIGNVVWRQPEASVSFDWSLFEDATQSKTSKAPERPPPPRMSASVPDRPPPPTIVPQTGSVRLRIPQPPASSGTSYASATAKQDWTQQKAKIVEDLLMTETSYLSDLSAWEACIQSSNALTETRKSVLTNGLPMLRSLSQKLIEHTSDEQGKLPEQQCYGEIFMQMRNEFIRTYAYHFRSVEAMSDVIDNNDQGLQKALRECLAEMRQLGSNVFDVPTAVSRPIQRCLKYPLYIGELLKNTPLTHRDHPKLMESLKQMGHLASKMNESKRRKELTRKYQSERQATIGDRLSKLNLHSVFKKGNRLKYRIGTTIGLQTIRDVEFDYMIAKLDNAERRVCKFLYALQIYKKRMSQSMKKYVDNFSQDSKRASSSTPSVVSRIAAFNSQLKRLSLDLKSFLKEIDERVINAAKGLLRCEYTKLIHKRCDKLADYEVAISSSKSKEEIERRRCEYEALNTQVKHSLPRVVDGLNAKVFEFVQKVRELDRQFFSQMERWYRYGRIDEIKSFPIVEFREFADPEGSRLQQIERVLAPPSAMNYVAKKDPVKVLNRAKLQATKKPAKPAERRPQTPKEADALAKIMKAQGRSSDLRRVTTDFSTDTFLVRRGDVVAINRDLNDYCVCENGVSVGSVPPQYLVPLDVDFHSLPPSPVKAPSNGPPLTSTGAAQPSALARTVKQEARREQSLNLIDFGDTLLDLSDDSPNAIQPPPSTVPPSMTLIDYSEEPPPARRTTWEIFDSTSPPASAKASYPTIVQPAGVLVPPAEAKKDDDPFAELFRSAMNMTLSKVQDRRSPTPTPVVPDRPVTKSIPATSAHPLPPPRQPPPPLPVQHAQKLTDVVQPREPPPSIPVVPQQAPVTGVYSVPSPTSGNEVYDFPPAPEPHQGHLSEQPLQNVPVRSAPPPPGAVRTEPANPDEYVCEYDFTPDAEDLNQLTVRETDVVRVKQRWDDSKNPEWWLVENRQGAVGYVPASFMKPQNANGTSH